MALSFLSNFAHGKTRSSTSSLVPLSAKRPTFKSDLCSVLATSLKRNPLDMPPYYTKTYRLHIMLNPKIILLQNAALLNTHLPLINLLRCTATMGNCSIIATNP
jgi:hypothetical protein